MPVASTFTQMSNIITASQAIYRGRDKGNTDLQTIPEEGASPDVEMIEEDSPQKISQERF